MPVEVKCQTCGKTFEAYSHELKRGRGKYCSKKCMGKGLSKKLIKKCDYCNKEYEASKKNQKYCSKSCQIKARTKKIKKTCLTCNKTFEVPLARQKSAKYCSRECYDKNNIAKKHELTCKQCGKNFTVQPYRIKENAQYCSLKCYYEYRNNNNKIKRTCKQCGKEFNVTPSIIKHTPAHFCSRKCFIEFQDKRLTQICKQCGKEFKITASTVKKGHGTLCSRKCQNEYFTGKNASAWKGGISFEPYCSKFNNEFKERVRKFWGRKCGICGKTEKSEGKKLAVHHVNYIKMVCCDNTPPLFIPLCKNCHPKTNWNREYWEEMLTSYIMIWFNGESYIPKS